MPTVRLTDRALITVSGPDAEHLLQNIITTDLDTLKDGEMKPGALLTPQGKILFDFLVSRAGENALRLDVRADVAGDFAKRLMLYRLRAKAEILKQDQADVVVDWETDSASSQNDSGSSQRDSDKAARVADTRFADIRVDRLYDAGLNAADNPDAWTRLRIAHGVAESGADYALNEAFPHDVLLDQNGGVGFKKGCYVGQEVVSRMQHRGTARRRVLIADADGPLPQAGTPVTAGGREIGTLGGVSGGNALAVVRIDKVKDALDAGTPILAGDAILSLSIPGWAKFTFPETAQAEGA